MKAAKIITGLLALVVSLPITFYLQYKILSMIQATDVMWLLFWVNVPMFILIQVVSKIAESVNDK